MAVLTSTEGKDGVNWRVDLKSRTYQPSSQILCGEAGNCPSAGLSRIGRTVHFQSFPAREVLLLTSSPAPVSSVLALRGILLHPHEKEEKIIRDLSIKRREL